MLWQCRPLIDLGHRIGLSKGVELPLTFLH